MQFVLPLQTVPFAFKNLDMLHCVTAVDSLVCYSWYERFSVWKCIASANSIINDIIYTIFAMEKHFHVHLKWYTFDLCLKDKMGFYSYGKCIERYPLNNNVLLLKSAIGRQYLDSNRDLWSLIEQDRTLMGRTYFQKLNQNRQESKFELVVCNISIASTYINMYIKYHRSGS